jgi:hypothetical protein
MPERKCPIFGHLRVTDVDKSRGCVRGELGNSGQFEESNFPHKRVEKPGKKAMALKLLFKREVTPDEPSFIPGKSPG